MTLELTPDLRAWPNLEGFFASLPWYDLPEMQDANDALWRALALALEARGVDGVPPKLDRRLPYSVDWNGACLLTQTCGYPIFTTCLGQFTIVATPCYDAPGCAGEQHRSFIVVNARSSVATLGDLRGATFAINEPDSNSGMNLARRLVAPLARAGRFFASTIVTGSHAASAERVAAREIDAAAVDCVSFALLQRYRPSVTANLRIVAETPTSPAPPLVTSRLSPKSTLSALRAALRDVLDDPAHAQVRAALFLGDVAFTDESAYAPVMTYEREAIAFGYPVLA